MERYSITWSFSLVGILLQGVSGLERKHVCQLNIHSRGYNCIAFSWHYVLLLFCLHSLSKNVCQFLGVMPWLEVGGSCFVCCTVDDGWARV